MVKNVMKKEVEVQIERYKKYRTLMPIADMFSDYTCFNTLSAAKEWFEEKKYTEAIPILEEYADSGYAEAQYLSGICYQQGLGVDISAEKAFEYFKTAARQGYVEAQVSLTDNEIWKYVIQEKEKSAIQEKIKPVSEQENTGILFEGEDEAAWKERMLEKDFSVSEEYTSLSKDPLFVEANAAYVRDDYAEALELFKDADEQGNIYSAAHIGIMYYYGYGCSQNYNTSFMYFKKGAENGCPLAAAWVSEYYRFGHSVQRDKEYAKKLDSKTDSSLQKMCDSGDMAALYFLGYNRVMGVHGKENEEEGIRLLRLACEKGEKRAAVQLASCYDNGWGVERNPEMVLEILQKYPDPANKKAHFLLGKCYYWGNGTEKDPDKAYFHFKIAAFLGYGRAKDYLGDCYYKGVGTDVDYVEAARWFTDAADNHGIGNSAHSLAFMYLRGDGVEKNEPAAMQYFLLAAQKGINQAQRIIAHEYITGEYFEQNYETARMWAEKAAEQGNVEAQYTLGCYYVSGFGFDSEEKSFEWMMKAAKQGYPEAEYAIGGYYLYNVHVDTDFGKANEWFEIAAGHGHGLAAYELGNSYVEGRGVRKSLIRAKEWYIKAIDRGISEAKLGLGKLYLEQRRHYSEAFRLLQELTPDNIDQAGYAEAQYWLSVCLENGYGCKKDKKLAGKYYQEAAAGGYTENKRPRKKRFGLF